MHLHHVAMIDLNLILALHLSATGRPRHKNSSRWRARSLWGATTRSLSHYAA